MPRRDALLLRITAVWTFFIWFVFVRNMLKDKTHGTGFKAVHFALAVISVALAVGIWRVASRVTRRARETAGSRP
jgi:Ca2+/H+ antiporter